MTVLRVSGNMTLEATDHIRFRHNGTVIYHTVAPSYKKFILSVIEAHERAQLRAGVNVSGKAYPFLASQNGVFFDITWQLSC